MFLSMYVHVYTYKYLIPGLEKLILKGVKAIIHLHYLTLT
jgi:hypothetical protein